MLPAGLELAEERRIFYEGIALFNDGQFFEAHETWEDIWKGVADRRREQFYRAIIQAAVTLELLRRQRAVGVRQVFVSCLELFDGLGETFMGLNIPGFIAQLRHAVQPTIDDLESRFVRFDASRLFQIRMEYDPFAESRNGENAEPG